MKNFSIASKLIDGVKSEDFGTILAPYYTLSKNNGPTPEEKRQKSREYMLMKPKEYGRNLQGETNNKSRRETSAERRH